VCVKYQIKLIGLCGIIALDIGGLFFQTLYVSYSATIFKYVDVFVFAVCRRSIIFVLIQVMHFMFIARNILLMMMMIG